MLFPYPPSGYQANWLHEALTEMFDNDLDRIDAVQPPIAWPECIPLEFREALRRFWSLRDRRIEFLDSYEHLSEAERVLVRQSMARHNDIPGIFDDGIACPRLPELPEAIRGPARRFYEAAFGTLTGLGLRDENYKRLYRDLPERVCAYCGVESLDAPGGKREALDHYLASNLYPFAGVNFRNLTPMGNKCNSRYKLKQDILLDSDGNRRSCFDPYSGPAISLRLDDSRLFEGAESQLVRYPAWVIEWQGGDPDKVRTWEEVFCVSDRYRNSHLNDNFRGWIIHFCKWTRRRGPTPNSPDLLRDLLNDFADIVVPEGYADSAHLKRATFVMLANKCNNSPEGIRLFNWLHDNIVT